jgi:hypothetical protein
MGTTADSRSFTIKGHSFPAMRHLNPLETKVLEVIYV